MSEENDRETVKPPMSPGYESAPDSYADAPLRSGARRIITSSKGLLCVAAIVGVCVMNYLGRIDGERALEFITWLVGFYVAGVAFEDGVEKFRPKHLGSANIGALQNIAFGIVEAIKSYAAQNQPTGASAPASTCTYTVRDDDDDLDAVVAAAFRGPDGAPAPADLIQRCISMINLLNGGTPDQYWKPEAKVILPRHVCMYLIKIHPEMSPQ